MTVAELGALLDFVAEVGYQLQMAGGEIYRVEESVKRLLAAYGAEHGEVFAIPNCLIVSVSHGERDVQTRVRRVGDHDTDVYRVEAINALCRKLCRQPGTLEEARRELKEVLENSRQYSTPVRLLGFFSGAMLFTLFFGGTIRDGICAGICGAVIGVCRMALDRVGAKVFFRTILCAAVSGLLALALVRFGAAGNADLVTIGALMTLVPGVALTNAIRDIMVGDMISGITKLGEAVLIAIAIALGSGAAMWVSQWLGGMGI